MRCPFLARTAGDGVEGPNGPENPGKDYRVATTKSSHIRTKTHAGWLLLFRKRDSIPVVEEQSIRAGRSSRVTIREVADAAGVSIATVSRVINERADVSVETRDLVQRVVREHGYTPNRNAQKLSAG